MSQLNGNDIDDLFRRASDRYPLRTDKADWDRVAADLERDPSLILPPISEEGDGRRKRRFFWLFLLLPLGGAGYFVARQAGHGSNSQPVVTRSQQQKGSNSKTSSSQAPRPLTSIPSSINPNSSSIPSGGATTSGREIATGSQVPAGGLAYDNGPVVPDIKYVAPRFRFGIAGKGDAARGGRNGGKTTELSGEKTSVADGKTNNNFESDNITEPGNIVGSGSIGGSGNMVSLHPMGPHPLQLARTGSGIALDVKVASRNEPAPATTTKLAKPKTTHFYAGLFAAPDLSVVKFQSMKAVGTTYGLLLGYNINRRWALETGLYLDRKKYYTDGEYFSTKNIYMQPNVKISTLNGVCNMWEIPVNVRYNLSQGEKTKWFATAGFSTYLMTKENYDYQLENTSSGASWALHKQYTTPRNYLFSVVNLSVGYEQKIGKVGNLRIEPYLRVPTAGIGTGSLPIMSAGLNIGITRRIW